MPERPINISQSFPFNFSFRLILESAADSEEEFDFLAQRDFMVAEGISRRRPIGDALNKMIYRRETNGFARRQREKQMASSNHETNLAAKTRRT